MIGTYYYFENAIQPSVAIDCLNVVFFWQEDRSISRFVGYALCAANEALRDANWMPTEEEEKEKTVIIYNYLSN